MNRIKKALEKRTPLGLEKISDEIQKGISKPLSEEEVNCALEFLLKTEETSPFIPFLWKILIYSKDTDRVNAVAFDAIKNSEHMATAESYRLHMDMPLRFLFFKIKDEKYISDLVSRFGNANSSMLRMVVAEYLIQIDVERGIYEMLKILPMIGYDHATADSIAMWLGEKGNNKIKHEIEKMAAYCSSTGDVENAKQYEWAASMIVPPSISK